MSFLRHKEIYRSDEGVAVREGPLANEVQRGGSMSFLRHKEICRSAEGFVVRERQRLLSLPTHRLDEFPVGYSWRVALQQSPLPLHQPRLIVRERSVEGKNFFRPSTGVS